MTTNMRLDNAIANAIRNNKINARQGRLVRAIVEVTDTTFEKALVAAEVLDNQGLMPHQIRTNYGAAGITYDMVQEALNNY